MPDMSAWVRVGSMVRRVARRSLSAVPADRLCACPWRRRFFCNVHTPGMRERARAGVRTAGFVGRAIVEIVRIPQSLLPKICRNRVLLSGCPTDTHITSHATGAHPVARLSTSYPLTQHLTPSPSPRSSARVAAARAGSCRRRPPHRSPPRCRTAPRARPTRPTAASPFAAGAATSRSAGTRLCVLGCAGAGVGCSLPPGRLRLRRRMGQSRCLC